jgi:hypothetical protein
VTKQYAEIQCLLAANKLEGLAGKGASEDQVRACERDLNLRFPLSYRLFLREFGWGYFGSLELIAGLGSDIPKEWERGANVLHIVTDERQGPLHIKQGVIPFCQNGAGDWYALDDSKGDGEWPVVFIAHEESVLGDVSANKCADSFADWIFAKLSDNPETRAKKGG